MDDDRTPTDAEDLGDLLDAYVRGAARGLVVALPGLIVRVDLESQRATVQPYGGRTVSNPDTGDDELVAYGQLHEIPLAFPGGASGGITWEPRTGDGVLLVACSTALDRWRGGSTQPPTVERRGSLRDLVAIPGLTARPHLRAVVGATVIHGDDVRAGGADMPTGAEVARQIDLVQLAEAIAAAPTGIAFGAALQAALAGISWPSCTAKLRSA